MAKKSKMLIADDHAAVIEGIRTVLSEIPWVEVVGTARDGSEVLEKIESLKPDIVIMDISMPHMNGVEATRRIGEIAANCRVIIYSMYSDREYVLALFRAGVAAYVLKEDPMSELSNAAKAVQGGANYYAESIRKIIQDQLLDLELGDAEHVREVRSGIALLSTREKEVFPLLADGLSVREIAKRLYISPKTVETHKYNIMEKLNVRSLTELTKMAIKKDIIKL